MGQMGALAGAEKDSLYWTISDGLDRWIKLILGADASHSVPSIEARSAAATETEKLLISSV